MLALTGTSTALPRGTLESTVGEWLEFPLLPEEQEAARMSSRGARTAGIGLDGDFDMNVYSFVR
jgi:hypothetical protein